MSITSTVRRSLWLGAAIVLTLAVVVDAPPRAAAVNARPRAPGATSSTDPVARIAELTAMVDRRDGARANAEAQHIALGRRLAETRRLESAALARSDLLGERALAAEREYRVARADLGKVAASYYRDAGSPTVMTRLFESRSAVEFGYRQKIIENVGDRQATIVKIAVRARREAQRAVREVGNEQVRLRALAQALADEIPKRAADVERLQSGLSSARFWLSRWQSVAAGVNTPIMSRSVLGPSELAAWFNGTRRRARITVSIQELAEAFIDEGQSAQVRGDVAFAQSILETGSFHFPDGGQLTPTDNNFAGINACDSCPSGSSFPDARTGVRAQMQLLRVYADANLTNAQLNPPAVDARLDTHFLKGEVPTWDGLTHTWATADQYGDRIVGIYTQILAWLTDRAEV